MLIGVIIGLIIIVLVIVVAGLIRVEKVEVSTTEEDTEVAASDDEEADFDVSAFQPESDQSLKEKVELSSNFEKDKNMKPLEQSEAEELFTNIDRLCEFKTGRSYLLQGQKVLEEGKAQGAMYAAARFDLDRFRFINSLKGYSIGDYVLTRIGQEIQEIFPQGSQFTRISADHFAVICPLVDENMFVGIDEKLRSLSEKIRGDIAVKSGLRICMGIALTDNLERDYNVSVLLHKANIARHCIKVSRSETYKMFEETMASTFLFGESALEDYSENQFAEEFKIYFVPQEDYALHQVISCEILTRWTCEVDNEQIFPLSLSKSMLPTNHTKIVYQVCKAMNRWRKSGKRIIPTSISLPPTELFKEDLDEFIVKCLTEFHLEPKWLNITIDASILRVDWTISKQVKKLREIGVGVGVEEIDVGYRKLDFLSDMHFDYIKLHRSFATDVDKDSERLQKVRAMLAEAKNYNVQVYFEGVDTQEQAEALESAGGRLFQGLYCGKPQKSEDFSNGLPDYVEQHQSHGTVILDESAFQHGDFTVF